MLGKEQEIAKSPEYGSPFLMKKYVIIVAGGIGIRMQATIPKQFLLLDNKPLLMHTLEVFSRSGIIDRLVVVLPSEQISCWQELCDNHEFDISHEVVPGGAKRFYSVRNGLEKIPDDCLVAVHDGVRPLVAKSVIEETFRVAEEKGAAIPVIQMSESIRHRQEDGTSLPADRDEYVLVQTPQVFYSDILKSAYQRDYKPQFTDDASVVENSGHKIFLTEGNRSNIKITTPYDFDIASALIHKKPDE